MVQIPVYAFTGFLDSGKTKFIQETLEDERFNAGERTLLLVFEEGEEEYDFSTYPHKNVYLETLDQQTVTTKELQALAKKYKAQRVVAELNGMQQVGDLYMRFPENWAVAQEVMFADSTTIMAYNANMRNLVMDKLVGAQMVVFNRLEKGADVMPLHKLARAANRRIDILYDYTDGSTSYDDIEDPLPFDINAPVIQVKDEDYALFYRDVSEEVRRQDRQLQGSGGHAPPGQERYVCPRPIRDDLLCGGHPVLRHSLPVRSGGDAGTPFLGHGHSKDHGGEAPPVQRGGWPCPDGAGGHKKRPARRPGRCDVLNRSPLFLEGTFLNKISQKS